MKDTFEEATSVNYDGPYEHQRRVSASSAILLMIFVAAALVMVAIVVWKPLVHQPSTPAASAGEAAPALQPAIPAPAAPEVSSP
ncbi:MAG: hypothetical protein Q7T33_14295 [Dehalococcoidia bacterium]|nr:hypothetical protein [Dehalococcoidia bacterium]